MFQVITYKFALHPHEHNCLLLLFNSNGLDKDSSFYCLIKSIVTTAITVGAILWDLSLGIFIGPLQQSHTQMGTHIEQLSDLKPFEVTAAPY